jgi:hypothetical protein
MFQHGAVEANDCCIRQSTESIDELANCDHGGSATALRKALLMALLLPSLTKASMVLFHLHDAGFGPKACGYDGAGDPCPASNDAAPELMPLPPGFENSITSIEVMRPLLRNPAGKRRRKP